MKKITLLFSLLFSSYLFASNGLVSEVKIDNNIFGIDAWFQIFSGIFTVTILFYLTYRFLVKKEMVNPRDE
ncbi:MAG: hypothetical protein K8R44_04345 [Sulfurimonas sp.]|nr:hypothetical protein [Sulfurimonas sp.]